MFNDMLLTLPTLLLVKMHPPVEIKKKDGLKSLNYVSFNATPL